MPKIAFRKLKSWQPIPSCHVKYMGKQWKQWLTSFWGAPKSLQMAIAAMKLKDAYSLEGSRDITLSAKVCVVKAMVFPVVRYGCESWNIKKAQCQRIDAFELWCWKRLLRAPWTARRSKQSIFKGNQFRIFIGLTVKLKLQYFGYLVQTTDSL